MTGVATVAPGAVALGALGKPAEPTPLPSLRPELRLLEGSPSVTGEPTWLVHDPLLNRFIQIDAATYETLRHWSDGLTAEALIAKVNAAGRVSLDADAVRNFVDFLHGNNLTQDAPRNGWRHFAVMREKGRHSPFAWLVHNYLFFRVPLCRPQAFLERTLPAVSVLWSRQVVALLVALGLVGLYLVARQWDLYVGTLQGFFTWEGALIAALGLGLVKAAHELGHAYTAVRYGCRVHTMGLAFIVMAPLLYTDVTDAWRLRDRRKRLAIDSAGIKVEVAIAAVALFLWAFMPEGPLRSLAFVLSAVSVVSSLAINLNPFMRFDGYYLLSEAVGIENLQPRAFAIGRWQLREWLFALGEPAPEEFPRRLNTFLVLYAWSIWIYRLVLFIGIALLVYHYFFKALGIILFAVEIIYFVARPIWSEMRAWSARRSAILKSPRAPYVAGILAVLVLLACVPWSTSVEIPAVVESAQLQRIFPVRAARVAAVRAHQGDSVQAGDILVQLASPDIDQELGLAETKLRLARLQHARRGADRNDLEESAVLESTISALASRIEGLRREKDELTIRAPFAGRVAELNPLLHEGRWIGVRDMIAIVTAPGSMSIRGYVPEADMWRLAPGAPGRFVPEQAQRGSIAVTIKEIAPAAAGDLEIADLTSRFSGRIAVNADSKRRLVPTSAQYVVSMAPAAAGAAPELIVRGVVAAQGTAQSLLARVWRQTLRVLVRESGV